MRDKWASQVTADGGDGREESKNQCPGPAAAARISVTAALRTSIADLLQDKGRRFIRHAYTFASGVIWYVINAQQQKRFFRLSRPSLLVPGT